MVRLAPRPLRIGIFIRGKKAAIGKLIPFLLLAIVSMTGCGQGAGQGAKRNAALSQNVLIERSITSENVEFNTEEYEVIEENAFFSALEMPQSTFSIDVDTASYSNVRRMLKDGKLPPAGAVRIEELVNYFHYDYADPEGEHPFSVSTELADCPWNPNHELLRIGLKGEPIRIGERPSSNLVFLLDVSGSMAAANKLPLVKSALMLLLGELNPNDRIAIVVYAGASGVVLDSTSAKNYLAIEKAMMELHASGGTNGGEGIQLAYRIAHDNFIDGGVNRVILCTDGDFNLGTTNQSELVKMIETKAKDDVFLTVLGFGKGNYKDTTMEKLADHGNGNYAYIDSVLEAQKVLVQDLGGTLQTIAKDVKIQVDFNPAYVESYRLIGYENRLLSNRDFRDDSKDAGEIGAGHCVTAFYEIVPAGSITGEQLSKQRQSEFVSRTLYSKADQATKLTVNLRYKLPSEDSSSEFQVRVQADDKAGVPSEDFQFASAVVGYGMLLRSSKTAGQANWDWVIATASQSIGEDTLGLREEFVQLAKFAKRVAHPGLIR